MSEHGMAVSIVEAVCVQGVVLCVCVLGKDGNRFVSFAELCSEQCCNDTTLLFELRLQSF